MTHTETVRLILDATEYTGTLFHTLQPTTRRTIKVLGRAYAMAHAKGNMHDLFEAERSILKQLGR